MKKLFFGLLAVGMISSSLFGYRITSKYDTGGDYQIHTWNFTLQCNNGLTESITLSKYLDSNSYTAIADNRSYNGTNVNQVFDQAARDACGE